MRIERNKSQKKGGSKGKARRLKKVDKKHQHKNDGQQSTMSAIQALVGDEDDDDGPPQEVTSKAGPDMLLSMTVPDESLVEQVLNAAKSAVDNRKVVDAKVDKRPKLVCDGEYVAATSKSQFRLVDLSSVETPTELRANVNFRDEMLRSRTSARRISGRELFGHIQKKQWIRK